MGNQFADVVWPGWEVVQKLGEGSFGGVYEIQRTLPDGQVEKGALKKLILPKNDGEIEELRSSRYDDASITEHFANQMKGLVGEYGMMKKLSGCPNIVHSLDLRYIQHEDGIGWDLYIRMELLTPLKKYLPTRYDEQTALNLGMNLCAALEACEKEHIIHRDIKPENILVSDNGVYKLGDFGVAKVAVENGTGTLTGTTGYMAPEISKHEAYGPTVDIYSLGMVLYWLMNERTLPFLPYPPQIPTAFQRQEASSRRFRGDALPAPKNGSEALKQVVLKACAYKPEDRYQTASEMQYALRVCMEDMEPTVYEPAFSQGAAITVPPKEDKPKTVGESVEKKREDPPKEIKRKKRKAGKKLPVQAILAGVAAVVCVIGVFTLLKAKKKQPAIPESSTEPTLSASELGKAEENSQEPVLNLTLFPDETASFAEVKHDAALIEKRIKALSADAQVSMNEDNGQINAKIPMSDIGLENDVERVIRAAVSRKQELCFVRYIGDDRYIYDDETGIVNRGDIVQLRQSTVGEMSNEFGMPAEVEDLQGDVLTLDRNQPCIYLQLTGDRAEKMSSGFDREGTDTFGLDVSMSNSVLFPYTYRIDGERFVLVAAGWKEENLTKAIVCGLSNEAINKSYTWQYAIVPEADWETRDDGGYFGQKQLEFAELEDPDNTVSLRFEILNYSSVSDMLIEKAKRQLKDKMDLIGMPYVFGRDVQKENTVVIRTDPERLNPRIAELIATPLSLNTAYPRDIPTWNMCVKKAEIVPADDGGSIGLQVRYTDAAEVKKLTSSLRWKDNKTLSYGRYNDPLVSAQITATVENDTLCFTELPMLGMSSVDRQYQYILELMAYTLQAESLDVYTYYKSYTFNSENAHFGISNATEAERKIIGFIQEKYPDFEVWLDEESSKYLCVSMHASIRPKFYETCFNQVEDIFKLCNLDKSDLNGAVFYLIDEKGDQYCRLVFTRYTGEAYMRCTGDCGGNMLDGYREEFAKTASWRLFFQKRKFEMRIQ